MRETILGCLKFLRENDNVLGKKIFHLATIVAIAAVAKFGS